MAAEASAESHRGTVKLEKDDEAVSAWNSNVLADAGRRVVSSKLLAIRHHCPPFERSLVVALQAFLQIRCSYARFAGFRWWMLEASLKEPLLKLPCAGLEFLSR
jgi:hypothetical protein